MLPQKKFGMHALTFVLLYFLQEHTACVSQDSLRQFMSDCPARISYDSLRQYVVFLFGSKNDAMS